MKVQIIIHPTCATSYKLVKHLHTAGLLDRVEITGSSRPGDAMRHIAWSVPWIIVDGQPAATDPVSPEEVEELVKEGRIPLPRDPVEAFMNTVLHSAYASSVALLHKSIEPVLDRDLIMAALRTPLGGPKPEELEVGDNVYSRWEDKLARALAISLAREIWWSYSGQPPEQIDHDTMLLVASTWLIAKASIGRAGIPDNPQGAVERGKPVADFLARTYKSLIRRVEREQTTILGDSEYWRILEEYGVDS